MHIDDVLGSIEFIDGHPDIEGVVNVSAPTASDNAEVMRVMRSVARRPFGLPAYRWMIEPAMAVLRTEPELIVKSRWVAPERLVQAGYRFRWPELEPALRDLT